MGSGKAPPPGPGKSTGIYDLPPLRRGRRKVALGRAIIWSPAEIDRMCRVTATDVRLARLWWRKHAPAKYRRLLDAAAVQHAGPDERPHA